MRCSKLNLGAGDAEARNEDATGDAPSYQITKNNATAADSRRLVGAHWSRAVPDTVMSRALLKALRRRAVVQ
jgi:hypothetical protein